MAIQLVLEDLRLWPGLKRVIRWRAYAEYWVMGIGFDVVCITDVDAGVVAYMIVFEQVYLEDVVGGRAFKLVEFRELKVNRGRNDLGQKW
jgi:hypothetical protein